MTGNIFGMFDTFYFDHSVYKVFKANFALGIKKKISMFQMF